MRYKLKIQHFGGRGSNSPTPPTQPKTPPYGTVGEGIYSTNSLISMRERKQKEVDEILEFSREMEKEFGTVANDFEIATMWETWSDTMAFFSPENNSLAVNIDYFDSEKLDQVYDNNVKSGFHPSRGSKTGLQATVAHEFGHLLTWQVARRRNQYPYYYADDVVSEAFGNQSNKGKASYSTIDSYRRSISRYALKNSAETIAEAFTDVYSNGNKAKEASRAIADILIRDYNKYK